MKKLKLDLDRLKVESFPTSGGRGKARGTVRAHELSWTCFTYQQQNVEVIYSDDLMPTDLCTLSCQESADYPCGGA